MTSKAPDKELRGLLAQMPEFEPELAAVLIDDSAPDVRELASHTKTLTSSGRRSGPDRPRTQGSCHEQTHHRRRPPHPGAGLLADVRGAMVQKLKLAESDLQFLLDDRSVDVRRSTATPSVFPDHLRKELENDVDETVADNAR